MGGGSDPDGEERADLPPGDGGDELLAGDADAEPDFADAAPADGVDEVDEDVVDPDLPVIHNHTDSSIAHVADLVRAAASGLGFPEGSEQSPNPGDRFFVGRFYMAWIDQTGFYGKMNGLWRLNGESGGDLDFVLKDGGGRPVNFLIVGELGDGSWAPGYRGAEHVEFPSRTPEAYDDPDCASVDWCNQYGLAEAAPITDPDIPWWSACNAGAPAWTDLFSPVVEEAVEGGIKLVYEGPLVKEADGDGTWDGDECHRDWLFPDGVRRRVFLRVGYELFGDRDYFDRTMQIRNPEGNPPFDGPMSLIGGFVMTGWPDPHPLKKLNLFLRPELRDVTDEMHGIVLHAGQWNGHDYPPTAGDEVFAWLDQPFSMSVSNEYVTGRSATISHVGPDDNADVGICLCRVHGAIEMGGGLIHGGVSLPIDGGASTGEARRRLALPGSGSGVPEVHVYEAESDLEHAVGRADGDGWSAGTADDEPGHMAYGPYAADWGGGLATAVFDLMVDDNASDNGLVVTLDVYDATGDRVLVSREVRRRDFTDTMTYQGFSLEADLSGCAGHTMETRVYWHDIAYVRLDKVTVAALH
jgi:hypothetical protein